MSATALSPLEQLALLRERMVQKEVSDENKGAEIDVAEHEDVELAVGESEEWEDDVVEAVSEVADVRLDDFDCVEANRGDWQDANVDEAEETVESAAIDVTEDAPEEVAADSGVATDEVIQDDLESPAVVVSDNDASEEEASSDSIVLDQTGEHTPYKTSEKAAGSQSEAEDGDSDSAACTTLATTSDDENETVSQSQMENADSVVDPVVDEITVEGEDSNDASDESDKSDESVSTDLADEIDDAAECEPEAAPAARSIAILDELEEVAEQDLSLDFTDLEIDENALVEQFSEARVAKADRDNVEGANSEDTREPGCEDVVQPEASADDEYADAEPTEPHASASADVDDAAVDEPAHDETRYVKTGRGGVRKIGAGAGSDLDALFARVSDLLGEPETEPDEPWKPPVPETMADTGLVDEDVERIVLKFLSARGSASGRQIAGQLRLPFRLVEPLLSDWKQAQLIAFKNAAEVGDYVYVITETGRAKATAYMAESTYFGAAPVQLVDYLKAMEEQSIAKQNATEEDLHRAFSDLLISPAMLERLGPAVNSGRGMFLFGEPGNGKTSIAERITACFGSTIWIPRALGVDGDIIRLFDPGVHEAVDWDDTTTNANSSLFDVSGVDPRWVRITRPTVVAGGELTMDELEVTQNPQTKVCEAPLQLKSNCGTLVIDDFGRQTMPVDVLLNRWIVPLEKRYDFLNLPSGKKIQVPFDQLIVFSTNLEPKDLVDGAFLRRIPYKIEVPDPLPEHFRKLFHIMAPNLGLRVDDEAIEYLIAEHFEKAGRPFRACLPRDLLLQVRNYCNYKSTPKVMTKEAFDFAVANYFSVM